LNTSLIAGIVIVLLAIAGGAVLVMQHGGNNSNTQSITPSTTTTQGQEANGNTQSSPHTTSHQQGSTGTADLSGTWHGTFTCRQGTGHFEWIIKKTGDKNYGGVLKVTDCYPTNGYIDIEVTSDGSSITIGTVGGASGAPAVTFQGEVSNGGSHAEGTWKFTNHMDSGTWKADRVSTSTQMPVQTSTVTESATNVQTTENEQPGGGQITCSPPPPEDYKTSYQAVLDAVKQVIGASNMECSFATMIGDPPLQQYAVTFDVSGVTKDDLDSLGAQLSEAMKSHGWGYIQMRLGDDYVGVTGMRNATVMGYQIGMLALVSVEVNDSGSVDLVIQIQPITS
jgi:hypothetical protein